ncbi:MAG: transposase [Candidatus Aminicenantales bacterium]
MFLRFIRKGSLGPVRSAAAEHFRQWYYWATHSRLGPMIQAAKSFKSYLKAILNYFTHRMTNAVAERLNSKIEGILKSAMVTGIERTSKPLFISIAAGYPYIRLPIKKSDEP